MQRGLQVADDIIIVKNLTKTFKGDKKSALNNVSFNLERGRMAALVGPDGAGKTTLLRMLCALILPDNKISSNVIIDGISVFEDSENSGKIKNIIGYMPQKFGLYEDLTVIENLNLFMALNGKNKSGENINKVQKTGMEQDVNEAKIATDVHNGVVSVDTLLEFAGLINFKTRLAGNLSGGMKQKLGLCCTLITKPKILLLDEPSVGVDPVSRLELMEIVQKLVKENNISVIWSTSYLDEAEKFEQVFLLSDGEKIYEGSPKSIKGSFEDFVINKIKESKGNNFKEALLNSIVGEGFKAIVPDDGITICAKGLTKVYNQGKKKFVAADNIELSIKKGEIFGLLGPNGAGKSTTFKMLCGLLRPSEGYSSILGVRMDENPSLARSYLGYMAQKFSLFGDLSVVQNLNFFAGVYGLSQQGFNSASNLSMDAKRRIAALLDVFDLKKYKNTNAKDLPLGYKQRLSLSCAIVHNPPVLFLDEPTSGVDPVSRREFWNQIKFLAKNGTTVLVTTHFMDEAQYCNRMSLVFNGKTLVTGTPSDLKNLVKSAKNPNPTMEDAFIELILRERESIKQAQSDSGSSGFNTGGVK